MPIKVEFDGLAGIFTAYTGLHFMQHVRLFVDFSLAAMATALVVAVFLILSADAPAGLTWSASLLTDEGFYSNAAVRLHLSGEWYVEGDFNPAVNMPVGHAITYLAFQVGGFGLVTARAATMALSVGAAILLVVMVGRDFGRTTGLFALVLILVGCESFFFSRLAFMEPRGMFFVALAMFLVHPRTRGRFAIRVMFASASIAFAVLLKPSFLFGTFALAPLVFSGAPTLRSFLKAGALGLLTFAIVCGGYQLGAMFTFGTDFHYFNDRNIQHRSIGSFGGWCAQMIETAKQLFLDPKHRAFCVASAAVVFVAAVLSPVFRRSPLVHSLILGGLGLWIILGTVSYLPPRYLVPFYPLLSCLAVIAATCLITDTGVSNRPVAAIGALLALPLAIVAAIDATRVIRIMANPSFTMAEMGDGVRKMVDQAGADAAKPIVFGQISDTLALMTGMRALNHEFGTWPLRQRVRQFQPQYMVSFDSQEEIGMQARHLSLDLDKIAEWNVLGNYYRGEPIRLFQIIGN